MLILFYFILSSQALHFIVSKTSNIPYVSSKYGISIISGRLQLLILISNDQFVRRWFKSQASTQKNHFWNVNEVKVEEIKMKHETKVKRNA